MFFSSSVHILVKNFQYISKYEVTSKKHYNLVFHVSARLLSTNTEGFFFWCIEQKILKGIKSSPFSLFSNKMTKDKKWPVLFLTFRGRYNGWLLHPNANFNINTQTLGNFLIKTEMKLLYKNLWWELT